MARPTRRGAIAVAAGTAVTLVLALPATAEARKPGKHHPAARPFVAHGLVVGHTASAVTVLAADLRSGKSVHRNTTVTVDLPSRRNQSGKVLARRLARMSVGDRITVNGKVTGSGDTADFTAKNFVGQAAPYHAYLGTVTAVDATMLTVDKLNSDPSDDPGESEHGSFHVDVTNATVSVDGAPGDLAVGQTVAVLGSSVHDVVTATSVFAFSVAPAVASGDVTAVDGAVVTVGGEDAEDGGDSPDLEDGDTGDAPATTTAVDLSAATLIVNGTSGATPDAVTVGARLVALGTDNGDGTFTASLAFAFTRDCSSRHHGDGGQDAGDDGGDDNGGGDGSDG